MPVEDPLILKPRRRLPPVKLARVVPRLREILTAVDTPPDRLTGHEQRRRAVRRSVKTRA